ncbi:hypothetical protein LWI29_013472 [Acer saccharum]|uniref:Uncharacterized protein n=1 Tax=Acer saccharum TaxID=4024 RepID=A0AA39VVB4_ACESA|nr:hypothetical protein LWI29_013472 [Acer saccharum]
MGNIKDSKRVVEIKAKKGDYLKLDGRRSYKNAGGSRFAIFNEVAEEVTAVEGQTSVDSEEKVLPSNILTEISNQDFGNKKKTAPFANKYLAHPVTGKGVYNKQLKENVNDKWGKKTGKGLSQPSSTTPSTQPISMDEDIDDSGVLQSLHKNILESEVPESSNQEIRPPPPGKLPNPSTVEFTESSTTLVEKVDVSAVVPASEMVDKKCKVDDNCVGECSSGCYGSGQPDPECLQAKSKFANFNSDDVDKAKSCRDSCLEECNNRALIGRSHIHVNGTVPLKFFSLLQPSLCLMTGFANIMHYFACMNN